jgi:hypothetical protein
MAGSVFSEKLRTAIRPNLCVRGTGVPVLVYVNVTGFFAVKIRRCASMSDQEAHPVKISYNSAGVLLAYGVHYISNSLLLVVP